jgi:hypothetical protein
MCALLARHGSTGSSPWRWRRAGGRMAAPSAGRHVQLTTHCDNSSCQVSTISPPRLTLTHMTLPSKPVMFRQQQPGPKSQRWQPQQVPHTDVPWLHCRHGKQPVRRPRACCLSRHDWPGQLCVQQPCAACLTPVSPWVAAPAPCAAAALGKLPAGCQLTPPRPNHPASTNHRRQATHNHGWNPHPASASHHHGQHSPNSNRHPVKQPHTLCLSPPRPAP